MQTLIDDVAGIVATGGSEQTITAAVADVLSAALAPGLEVPAAARRPDPDRYVMHPLHIADDGSFSIAAAVWDVGQGTLVHGHETWGVVGIHSGWARAKWSHAVRGGATPRVSSGRASVAR